MSTPRYAATISIGGKLRRSRVKILIELLNDGYEPDTIDDERIYSLDANDDRHCPTLPEMLIGCGVLRLECEQARYGEFPEIEAFCEQEGLTFARHSSAEPPDDEGTKYSAPGLKELYTTHDGYTFVYVEKLKALLDDNKCGWRFRRRVHELCRECTVPQVPPLEIVADNFDESDRCPTCEGLGYHACQNCQGCGWKGETECEDCAGTGSAPGLCQTCQGECFLQPVRRLYCSCCGAATQGRQWHNMDIGYGFCLECYDRRTAKGEDPEEITRCYGVKGVHFALETEEDKTDE